MTINYVCDKVKTMIPTKRQVSMGLSTAAAIVSMYALSGCTNTAGARFSGLAFEIGMTNTAHKDPDVHQTLYQHNQIPQNRDVGVVEKAAGVFRAFSEGRDAYNNK